MRNIIYLSIIASTFYLIIGFFGDNINNYSNTKHIVNDASSYLEAGKRLYHDCFFDIIRPAGISLFMGLPSVLFNSDLSIVRSILILHFLLWLFSVILVYKICKEYLSLRIAFVFSALYATLLSPIEISFFLLSETLFVFLLLLSIYEFIRYLKTRKNIHVIAFFVILSFAIIVRPIIFYFAIISLIGFIGFLLFKENKMKLTILSSLFSILILGIQYLGIYQHHKIITISDTMDKALYQMSSLANSIKNNSSINYEIEQSLKKRESIMVENNIDFREATKKLFIDEAKQNPYYFVKAYLISLKYNFIGYNQNSKSKFSQIFTQIQNFILISILFLSFLIMIYYYFKKKITLSQNIIVLLLMYFLSFYLVFMGGLFYWQGDRYNLPAFPFILIIFAIVFNIVKHNSLFKTFATKNTN